MHNVVYTDVKNGNLGINLFENFKLLFAALLKLLMIPSVVEIVR